jgi:hypothetical protein
MPINYDNIENKLKEGLNKTLEQAKRVQNNSNLLFTKANCILFVETIYRRNLWKLKFKNGETAWPSAFLNRSQLMFTLNKIPV